MKLDADGRRPGVGFDSNANASRTAAIRTQGLHSSKLKLVLRFQSTVLTGH